MSSFTLEVIFVGLIAFAPVDDGEWLAVLTREMEEHPVHVPAILQLEGTCKGGDCRFLGSVGDWCELLEDLEIKSSASADSDSSCLSSLLQGMPEDVESNRLFWIPLNSHVEWEDSQVGAMTTGEEFHMVPGVADVVLGGAGLRSSCKKLGKSCRLRSRIRIRGGELTSCHFIHPANHPDRWTLYEIDGEGRPVANMVLLTAEVEGPSLTLAGESYEGGERAKAKLVPTEGKVRLVVLNEPGLPIATSSTRTPYDPPERLSHYRSFYKLLRPIVDFFGFHSTTVPEKLDGFKAGSEGACESFFRRDGQPEGVPALAWSIVQQVAPHGPSECAMSSIP